MKAEERETRILNASESSHLLIIEMLHHTDNENLRINESAKQYSLLVSFCEAESPKGALMSTAGN